MQHFSKKSRYVAFNAVCKSHHTILPVINPYVAEGAALTFHRERRRREDIAKGEKQW